MKWDCCREWMARNTYLGLIHESFTENSLSDSECWKSSFRGKLSIPTTLLSSNVSDKLQFVLEGISLSKTGAYMQSSICFLWLWALSSGDNNRGEGGGQMTNSGKFCLGIDLFGTGCTAWYKLAALFLLVHFCKQNNMIIDRCLNNGILLLWTLFSLLWLLFLQSIQTCWSAT